MINLLTSLCLTLLFCATGKLNILSTSLLLCMISTLAASQPVFLGTLTPLQHGTRGKLYAIDEKTFFIQDFEYDGQGPSEYRITYTVFMMLY